MTADSTTTTTRRTNTAAAATPATIQADVHWVDTSNEEYNVKEKKKRFNTHHSDQLTQTLLP